MKLTVERDERAFDVAGAWRIIRQILCKRGAVIGLATGQTTGGMHQIVSEIYRAYPFDTSEVILFNVDELTNLDRSYPGSCFAMIDRQLVQNLDIPPHHFIMPLTLSDDFERECADFERRLTQAGGVDLQILGIGWNGHIGINQPGTPFGRQTWVSPMDSVFEARVRRETGVAADYPLGGLTRGIVNIMQSRRIVLAAKGAAKAEIIRQALCGPVSEAIPASALQLHPACEVLLDAEAASLLPTDFVRAHAS
ncbi:MAG: glucosamine-6-phosphate deaminase [Oscillospiraceae bacterium]|jgi:glucosamine-6-phosphate deaminase|nr:glucosamine-6-phosphate deaminase [Oscillospiraceae bacterium]